MTDTISEANARGAVFDYESTNAEYWKKEELRRLGTIYKELNPDPLRRLAQQAAH